MIGKIIDFIIGKVSFDITVNDSHDVAVLNLLRDSGFYGCKMSQGRVTFSCGCTTAASVSKRLDEIAVPYEMHTFGLIFFLKKIFSRPGILAGALLCIVLNVIFSGTLMKIEIVGNEKTEKDEIFRKLETFGIYEGCRKKDIDLKDLSRDYMIGDERFSFFHMNINGVTAVVEVAEAAQKKGVENEKKDKKEICNIVAKCDGVITRLDVYSGGAEVEKGQSVAKGQLLISSFFETRTAGVFLRRAKGNAFANTEPYFEMWIPKKRYERVNVSKITEKSLNFMGYKIALDRKHRFDNDVGTGLKTYEKTPALFGFLSLPCKISVKEYDVCNYKEVALSKDEARKKFDVEFENFKSEFENNATVLSYDTDYYDIDGYHVFVGRLSCIENIGIDKPFEIGEN